MASPKHKPNIIIQNDKQPHAFKSSSALVLNSFFSRYNPQLVNQGPELRPSPLQTLAPELSEANKPSMQPGMQPGRQQDFFNTQNVAKTAEGLGDLATAFASGNFFDDEFPQPEKDFEQPNFRAPNPAMLFSPANKLRPTPAPSRSSDLDLEKKMRQEEELKRRQQYRFGK